MTIRKYLFLLISSLLLIVALLQVAFIFYFKTSIEDEVERRGKLVANRLINMAIDSYGEDITTDNTVVSKTIKRDGRKHKDNVLIEVYKRKEARPIYIFDLPKHAMSDKDKLNGLLNNMPEPMRREIINLASNFSTLNVRQLKNHYDGYSIEISSRPNIPKHLVRQHLKQQIAKIYNEPTLLKNVDDNEEELHTQRVFHREVKMSKAINESFPFLKPSQMKDKRVINKMSYLMISVIILSTILGFILVYFFSKRFSKPLNNLVEGFKQLEQGSHNKVQEDGVEEVRATIERFNKMSQKLEELAKTKKLVQQQQHLSEISDISKGIAHALRNPLHTIGLAVEQLNDDSVSISVKQKLTQRIKNKINQLDKSIKALLTITSGEIERNTHVKINAVINDVILELRQSHDNEKAPLTIELNLEEELEIIGSSNEIRSVLHTLIFNAYEASIDVLQNEEPDISTDQKEEILLKISSKKDNEHVVIYVDDFGSGVKPEIESNLFQPHVSSKSEGAGMGLYIGKRIAQLYYNGDVTVTNNVDENKVTGVTATFTLSDANNQTSNAEVV
ncbi:MAG: HAMP domain-containing histidine kinase [Gammaproteobacteria bacterium]|nr:HAMP domain-containing histidine kinase [Gammaproteobacteria bacterium]